MLTLLSVGASPIQVTDLHDLAAQLHDALWIDVFNPSLEEERAVEQALGCDIPTKLEMEEIEASSRLHTEGSALIMTAMVLCNGDERDPESSPVTFILASGKLVTVRYNDPLVLRAFRARVAEGRECPQASDKALALLIDAFVDRLADILESVGFQVDKIS
ncbi:MAG: magnesium transporter, partial [Verrucomicrobiaceae bacterium]